MPQLAKRRPVRFTRPPRRRHAILRHILLWGAGAVVLFYVMMVLQLCALRWIDPIDTTVQVQRHIEALIHHRPYHKRYVFVPLSRISLDLQHAVISAEDGRFYQHHGIDWKQVQVVVDQDLKQGKLGRGASTITQQMIKNLFLTTHRSIIYKAIEFALAPVAEKILSKQRILELYLNVIEWGPGVYGAEAASEMWYHVPAARINRNQAARLAALIPSPLRRRPSQMGWYTSEILRRMTQVGW
ncbi:MAG TPA: monofunctional biosynthetic peptidoglycan transglycosylase [Bryobacteraceae bacterium]|nr:monofunctional biosynthetic peptidoglycan transglycosylase [Bryobacteraceae bacterium]